MTGASITSKDDDALRTYLEQAAAKERLEFVTEQEDGEWFARMRADTLLGPQAVRYSVNGPTERIAMERLAQLMADEDPRRNN